MFRRSRLARPLLAIVAMVALAGCGSAAGVGASGSAPETAGPHRTTAGTGAAGTTPTPSPEKRDSPIVVVASTNVWGGIASTIGGSRVSVESFIDQQSQDPHSYEPNPRAQLTLDKAELIIENGGGYDDFMTTMIAASGTGASVINAVEASGTAAAPSGTLNEHVWFDFQSVGAVAHRITAALATIDPAGAPEFERNLAEFDRQLAGLDAGVAAIKAEHAGEPVAVTEPVPLYLLQAAGLDDVTPLAFSHAVEEGSDVPARVLADTMALVTGKKVKLLVYNAQTSGPQTDKLVQAAEAHGVPTVAVTETRPDGEDYVTWMRSVVTALAAALGR